MFRFGGYPNLACYIYDSEVVLNTELSAAALARDVFIVRLLVTDCIRY